MKALIYCYGDGKPMFAGDISEVDQAAIVARLAPQSDLAMEIARKIVGSSSGKQLVKNIAESLLVFPRITATVRMLATPAPQAPPRAQEREP